MPLFTAPGIPPLTKRLKIKPSRRSGMLVNTVRIPQMWFVERLFGGRGGSEGSSSSAGQRTKQFYTTTDSSTSCSNDSRRREKFPQSNPPSALRRGARRG